MPQPTNGITPEIIRDLMPPYRLSQDLLAATLTTIPAPPPNATTTWRQARLTRLISEITAYHPADAAQARIAAQILGIRELADTITARAQAEASPLKDLCRTARSIAELLRSANALDRTINRHQQKPVPFHGTVIEDEVDLKTLDAQWTSRPQAASDPTPEGAPAPDAAPLSHAAAAPPPATAAPSLAVVAPPPAAVPPCPIAQPTAPPRAPAKPHEAATHAPAPTANPPAPTPRLPESTAHPTPAPEASHTRPAAPGSDWTITTLDSGPGWTREVLRHRSAATTPAEAAG